MLALGMIFVMWVAENIPHRSDINWLRQGGGIFSKGHPPAKKFNAGQKLIFWSVIVLGLSISVSGVSLLFPFELNMFAATFAKINATGIGGMLGFGELRETLAPHEEMQYAQLWHSIISFVLMAIILAHIYIGTVGMEGAYDAMGSGEVEEQWAREHHSLWVAEVLGEEVVVAKPVKAVRAPASKAAKATAANAAKGSAAKTTKAPAAKAAKVTAAKTNKAAAAKPKKAAAAKPKKTPPIK
jgi:formate dehydrogenase subunit gamma